MPTTNHSGVIAAVTILLLSFLTACSPTAQPTATLTPDQIRIDSIAYTLREPYNGQVYIVVKGHLPDACTTLDIHQTRDDEGIFYMTIETKRSADETCAQVLTPFTEFIPLEGESDFGAGTYTVIVNDIDLTFTLTEDDVFRSKDPDPGS